MNQLNDESERLFSLMTSDADIRQFVISVLVRDRIGILKTVTESIADQGGDIDSMSQTVTNGYFTAVLTARFTGPINREALQQVIQRGFGVDEASIIVREHANASGTEAPPPERYVMTLSGNDRPGLLKLVTGFLVEENINILDYYFAYHANRVLHIAEVEIRPETDVKSVSERMKTLMDALGITVTLQHEFLFRAANEIFSIRRLFTNPS